MSAFSTNRMPLCRHFEALGQSGGIFEVAILGRLRVRGKGLRPS
jgi:hypothetical protein